MANEVWFLVGGAIAAFALAWWIFGRRSRPASGEDALRAREAEARLDEARKALDASEKRVSDTFGSLSAEALRRSNEEFLKLAHATLDARLKQAEGDLGKREESIKGLVAPITEALKKVDENVKVLEQKREHAYGSLGKQLETLATTQSTLHKETATLSNALRNPTVRGRWGEITLKRVVELAGMTDHCAEMQATVEGENGALRPDLVVHLPGERVVLVDSKVPLQAYLDSVAATDDASRKQALERHAKHVRAHANQLAQKAYHDAFDATPEFVVLFIPGEPFLGAALEADTTLLDDAAAKGVILATPATLIALLRAVEMGWRQESVSVNAQKIAELGGELHKRLSDLADHFAKLGKNLKGAVESYNGAIGSYESRALVAARKLRDMGAAGGDEIDALEPIDTAVRVVRVGEERA